MRLLAFLVALALVSVAGVFQAAADVPPPYTEYTIGMSMTEGEPYPKVDSVLKGGPAARAGVKVGDQVIGLNGGYSKTLAPFYFFAKGLRGRQGSFAELVLLRGGSQVIVLKIKRTLRS